MESVVGEEGPKLKLVFVGDTACGKTSAIWTWTQGEFPALYEPTVFDTFNGTK